MTVREELTQQLDRCLPRATQPCFRLNPPKQSVGLARRLAAGQVVVTQHTTPMHCGGARLVFARTFARRHPAARNNHAGRPEPRSGITTPTLSMGSAPVPKLAHPEFGPQAGAGNSLGADALARRCPAGGEGGWRGKTVAKLAGRAVRRRHNTPDDEGTQDRAALPPRQIEGGQTARLRPERRKCVRRPVSGARTLARSARQRAAPRSTSSPPRLGGKTAKQPVRV